MSLDPEDNSLGGSKRIHYMRAERGGVLGERVYPMKSSETLEHHYYTEVYDGNGYEIYATNDPKRTNNSHKIPWTDDLYVYGTGKIRPYKWNGLRIRGAHICKINNHYKCHIIFVNRSEMKIFKKLLKFGYRTLGNFMNYEYPHYILVTKWHLHNDFCRCITPDKYDD